MLAIISFLTVQACAQTILALQISGEVRSGMWWLSNALVLGGSMGYTHFRRLEMLSAHTAASTSKA
jgi:GDP-fucose transporter C1